MNVEYRTTELQDLRVVAGEDAGAAAGNSNKMPPAIEAAGERLAPTARFWRSLFHRFGLAGNVFRYFRFDEVFDRVVSANRDTRLRLCIERPKAGAAGRLLAVSSPRRGVLRYDETLELVRRYSGAGEGADGDRNVTFHDGVLTSTHVPRSGEHDLAIGPDHFRNRFVMEVPVDGFGQPRIFLSLMREVCSNGAIGYSRAFRSDIRVGDDARHTVERAMAQFDHDEGFAALRQRFESAQQSWASLHETVRLQKVLCRIGSTGRDLHGDLARVTGDLHGLYGLANLESLSAKRQRVLPAKCRVYDLLNFASEVATHRAAPDARLRLQAYIGTLVSDEYDLEGTAQKVPDFRGLFLGLN